MQSFSRQLCLALLFVSVSVSQVSSVAVTTQAVITTVIVPTTSTSLSTYFITVASTSVLDDVSTYTTTISGVAITTSTDLGIGQKAVGSSTETVVTAVLVTGYATLVSTIGSTTIFGSGPSTSTAVTVAPSTPITSATSQPSTSSLSHSTNTDIGSTSVLAFGAGAASTISSIVGPSMFFTATPSATSDNGQQRTSSSISAGAKAGIAISAVTGSLAIFIVTFWLGRVWSRRKALATRMAADKLPAEDEDLGGFFSPVVSERSNRSLKTQAKTWTSVRELTTADGKDSSARSSEEPHSGIPNIAELSAQRFSVQSIYEKGDDEPKPARLSRALGGTGTHVPTGSVTALPQWNEKS